MTFTNKTHPVFVQELLHLDRPLDCERGLLDLSLGLDLRDRIHTPALVSVTRGLLLVLLLLLLRQHLATVVGGGWWRWKGARVQGCRGAGVQGRMDGGQTKTGWETTGGTTGAPTKRSTVLFSKILPNSR